MHNRLSIEVSKANKESDKVAPHIFTPRANVTFKDQYNFNESAHFTPQSSLTVTTPLYRPSTAIKCIQYENNTPSFAPSQPSESPIEQKIEFSQVLPNPIESIKESPEPSEYNIVTTSSCLHPAPITIWKDLKEVTQKLMKENKLGASFGHLILEAQDLSVLASQIQHELKQPAPITCCLFFTKKPKLASETTVLCEMIIELSNSLLTPQAIKDFILNIKTLIIPKLSLAL